MSQNVSQPGEEPAPAENSPRLGRAFIQDPHTLYRRLRAEAPAHRAVLWGGTNVWLVTRYAEARTLLNDPRLTKHWQELVEFFPSVSHGRGSVLYSHMLQRDPPDHTRLRKLVTTAFTAGSVQKMRPDIVGIADELLDRVAVAASSGEAVDLMRSYAVQLPLRVISELLGVPPADRENFRMHVEPTLTSTDPEELGVAENALADLLIALIEGKRRQPANDLLSALVHTSDVEDRLSTDELLSTTFLLILAGYETTVNLIGNGVLALLRNPSQLAALRSDPSLMPTAVEEFLRFESPLNMATMRVTTQPVRIGEVEIPAGQPVLVALLAANHDDRQYDDPDRLDVTRTRNPHLAFGYGIHHCLGAPLARLEGEIAIGRLLSRFERIALVDNVVLQYRSSTLMRGLTTLPVHLGNSTRSMSHDMKRKGAQAIPGPQHPMGMLVGVMLAPATPALIWVTLGANLPLAAIIVPLLILVVVSNLLSRITLRACKLVEAGSQTDQPAPYCSSVIVGTPSLKVAPKSSSSAPKTASYLGGPLDFGSSALGSHSLHTCRGTKCRACAVTIEKELAGEDHSR
jgi:cytochrome P450